MRVIQAPNYFHKSYEYHRRLFLAGGISGCGNWQSAIVEDLKKIKEKLLVYNPRRDQSIDRKNYVISYNQISWEFHYLRLASDVLFWFPKESVCPIALFELGGVLERRQNVFVGCDENYDRIVDLKIQLELAKFGQCRKLVHSPKELVDQFRKSLTLS